MPLKRKTLKDMFIGGSGAKSNLATKEVGDRCVNGAVYKETIPQQRQSEMNEHRPCKSQIQEVLVFCPLHENAGLQFAGR
jgi:hypothetical protein